jgi:hypothetical protein
MACTSVNTDDVLQLASLKLTTGLVFNPIEKNHVFAVVSQRFCLDPVLAGAEAIKLAYGVDVRPSPSVVLETFQVGCTSRATKNVYYRFLINLVAIFRDEKPFLTFVLKKPQCTPDRAFPGSLRAHAWQSERSLGSRTHHAMDHGCCWDYYS